MRLLFCQKVDLHAIQRQLHHHRQAKRVHGDKLLLLHLTPDVRERESTISREGIDRAASFGRQSVTGANPDDDQKDPKTDRSGSGLRAVEEDLENRHERRRRRCRLDIANAEAGRDEEHEARDSA